MSIAVVMPAYNAASTLRATVSSLPESWVSSIILCDDASQDDTVAIARDLGLTVIEHETNMGYGANQKTLYRAALERGADVVVMVHPDFQYEPSLAPYLVGYIERGHFDVMLGTRIRTRREALAGGMPLYKYISNRMLTLLENTWFGQNLSEWHTGMRAFSRNVLETLPLASYSNDFVFDSQMLMDCVCYGFSVAEVPVPVRYETDSSNINFRRSVRYGLTTLAAMLARPPWRRRQASSRNPTERPL